MPSHRDDNVKPEANQISCTRVTLFVDFDSLELSIKRNPDVSPKNARPVCERVKPWLFLKTNGKAPKNKYRIPSRIAESRQRFRHYGSISLLIYRQAGLGLAPLARRRAVETGVRKTKL